MQNNRNDRVKTILKFIGIFLLLAGFFFAVVGFVDFFNALSTKQKPTLLWCMFLGLPLMGIGSGFSVFAFRREIKTSTKDEELPLTQTCKTCGKISSVNDAYCSGCGNKL